MPPTTRHCGSAACKARLPASHSLQVVRQRVAELPGQRVIRIDRLVEDLEMRHGARTALPVMARHGGGVVAEVSQVRRRVAQRQPRAQVIVPARRLLHLCRPRGGGPRGGREGQQHLDLAVQIQHALDLRVGGAEIKLALLRLDRLPLGRPVAPPHNAGFPRQPHQEVPGIGVVEAERRVGQPRRRRSDQRAAQRLGADA